MGSVDKSPRPSSKESSPAEGDLLIVPTGFVFVIGAWLALASDDLAAIS